MADEEYAGHPLSGFLREFSVQKGEELSLTCMGKSKNKYNIPDSKYPQFLDILHNYLFVKNNSPNGLVEQRNPDREYPSLIDLDFKYNPSKSLTRVFTDAHIVAFIKAYSAGITRFYSSFPSGQKVRFFVSLRPQPYRGKKNDKAELKDGVHIQSPELVTRVVRQRAMRLWSLENNIIADAFQGTEYINAPTDIFDESLVKRNGWFLYGESKPDIPAYKLHKVYVLDTDTGDISEEPTDKYTARQLMELLSIRYNLMDELTETHETKDAEAAEELRRLLARSKDPETPVVRAKAAPATDDLAELPEALANYLVPQMTYSDRDMNLIRRLVLECLSDSRADNYSTWRETEWCLRNISDSEDMFKLWVDFSRKSKKASGINVDREYRDWRRGGNSLHGKKLTKRSLHYWAREDNPKKYEEIIKSDIVEWVAQGKCRPTHNHIAQLMSLLYDGDYRVHMDSKRVAWYHYTGAIWEPIVQGVELRMKLSSDVVDIITEGRKVRREFLIKQGVPHEDIGSDAVFKDLLRLEKDLYQCTFKNSVMQEAANTFYERDFEKKLNANTALVGCANCVINLRAERQKADGSTELYVEMRDSKPEDYISFLVGAMLPELEAFNYIPFSEIGYDDPEIKEILNFFKMIFPRPELCDFMLVLSAAMLEGENREQAFYFLTGVGSNGKSKYDNFMKYTLGDYYSTLSATALTRKRPDSGAANPDVIKTKCKRAIFIQEPDNNEPLNTSIMKQYSGEDDVPARGLYQDQDSFKMKGKCLMICNKLPPINTMDNGTWRRPRTVPFEALFVDKGDARFNPEKNIHYKDYGLDAKLMKWRVKFFSLLVHIYDTRYLKEGLVPPPIVMQAVNNYKYAHDSFAKFFDTCVRKDPEAEDITLNKVYKTYTSWLAGASGTRLKTEEFKTRLEEKLNTAIVKNIRGILVFASEEEADGFDKESTGTGGGV